MARSQLILDRYQPLGTAGSGGFGTVCIAWDQRIQRKVAIKTIQLSEIDAWRAGLPGADAVAGSPAARAPQTADRWHGVQPWDEYLAENDVHWPGEVIPPRDAQDEREPDAEEPFTMLAHVPGLDEARTAAKLQDPRIVGVFDFEVRGRVAYLIMEFVEGITLTQLLARYEDFLTLDVVAAVFDAVAGALTVAHKAGVLHLDIKPDNILINADGQVKVTDFGLATLADASGTGLAGGGTIGYMPLEQMRREPLDARTDEWALASVTYEMLTGDNPFHADSLEHAEEAIENAELVLPSLCWDDIDEQIDDVIFYALDPETDERYASVSDFAEEADKFLGDAAAGQQQLAVIVRDALGVYDDEDEQDDYDDEYEEERPARRRLTRLVPRLRDRFAENQGARERLIPWAGRAVFAVLLGFIAFGAMRSIYLLAPLFGRGAAPTVAVVCAIAVAGVGLALPHVGMLVACALAGFSLIVSGQVLAGVILVAVGIAWCLALSRLARHANRPVLLGLAAIACIAALVASFVLAQASPDLIPAAIAAIAAILASTLSALLTR